MSFIKSIKQQFYHVVLKNAFLGKRKVNGLLKKVSELPVAPVG